MNKINVTLQPAINVFKPMKALLYGPTYSGKTLGALYLALGVVMAIRKCTEEEAYKHIIIIDTEYGRGALYNKMGPYNYLRIDAPYDTDKLIDVITQLNYMDQIDVIIPDSLTHFWVKEGGILDQKAAKDKQGGNSYTNWLDFTAKFNRMLDVLLSSPKHIISTARAKSDTALVENAKGKMEPKTYGLTPELRDGITFDFDIVFNVDKDTHTLITEKGVPGMAPTYEIATPALGMQLYDLFTANTVMPVRTNEDIMESIRKLSKNNNLITFIQLKLSGRKLDALTTEELLALEADQLAEIKKMQIKK